MARLPSLAPEIVAYYQRGGEAPRLLGGPGRLEFARTQELALRHLPSPPAVVYDIGGGPGLYACWLASLGYEVHLVDAVPLHIEQARAASLLQADHPVTSITLGDARQLRAGDGGADAVLLLGPLYHLTSRQERIDSLKEAHRVLKPGGVLLAAAISRYASSLDGLLTEAMLDPDFVTIVERDLIDGQHRNPRRDRDYFTTAYLHTPSDLEAEVGEAGYSACQVLGIEGPGWLMQDLDARWAEPRRRELLLTVARHLEAVPALSGLSSHLLAVARA